MKDLLKVLFWISCVLIVGLVLYICICLWRKHNVGSVVKEYAGLGWGQVKIGWNKLYKAIH